MDLPKGWTVTTYGDNGLAVVRYEIAASHFTEASGVSEMICELLRASDHEDDLYYTQLTLRAWRVEVIVAVPTRTPVPRPQWDFMASVSGSYPID